MIIQNTISWISSIPPRSLPKVLSNVVQVFLEGMGFVLFLIGRLGEWYPVKDTYQSISAYHHALNQQQHRIYIIQLMLDEWKIFRIENVPRFHIAHAFLLFKRSIFCFVFNYRSFRLSNWNFFELNSKIKVHQKEFYSEIPLKIVLGKKYSLWTNTLIL